MERRLPNAILTQHTVAPRIVEEKKGLVKPPPLNKKIEKHMVAPGIVEEK